MVKMLKLNLCMATTVQHLQTQQAAVGFTTGSGRLHIVVLFDSNLFCTQYMPNV